MSEKIINDGGPFHPIQMLDFQPTSGEQVVRETFPGISKREWFAAMALQGMASISLPDGDMIMGWQDMSKAAVKAADCLMAELEAKQ